VRRSFEEHGDIKTFFDLIATRGMVFVTYVSGMMVAIISGSEFVYQVRFARSRESTGTPSRLRNQWAARELLLKPPDCQT